MAKTIEMGRAKWERKTANAGARWKSGTSGKGGEFARGLSEFAGGQVRGDIVSAWEQGVGAVSSEDFSRSIQGKGGKWADNTRRALLGA